jgi:hypothetical protein
MSSPTVRSTSWFRDHGYIVTRVEQIIHMPGHPFPFKRDAFNFGDLLAANPELRVVALVQVTAGQGGNFMARIRKIIERPEIARSAYIWLMAGGRIFVHGWAKRKPRGVKRPKWTLVIREIVLGERVNELIKWIECDAE